MLVGSVWLLMGGGWGGRWVKVCFCGERGAVLDAFLGVQEA